MAHDPLLHLSTLDAATLTRGGTVQLPRICLTVLAHPSAGRIGDLAWLPELDRPGGEVEVNRVQPLFSGVGGDNPLRSPLISRKAFTLVREAQGIRIEPGQLLGKVRVEGRTLTGPLRLDLAELERGRVMRVARHLVLLLHRETPRAQPPALDMVGQTECLDKLRVQIEGLGAVDGSVLIRGETGTGKEHVAKALHHTSRRRRGPFIAVNLASIPSELAASQLFGHVRGAFSGAVSAQDGLFVAADGGTLFLDEIGDASDDVQAALLRVLDTGEVLAVGASRPRKVNVRVVAATDADLEAAIDAGRFRGPVYWRLASTELKLPTLRDRRADIGRLLVHFLRNELSPERLALLEPDATDRRVWLSAEVAERLALHDWPGNIRELRNMARSLAQRGGPRVPLQVEDLDGRLATRVPRTPPPAEPAARNLRPRDISSESLEQAMASVDWAGGAAAKKLGISRFSLNELIDAHPSLKRAKFLTDSDIEAARIQSAGTGAELWQVLRVSKRGLARRLTGTDRA